MAKRIAILATDGFEQSELTGPRDGLKAAGFDVQVVSPKGGEIKGWKHTDWGDIIPAFDFGPGEQYDGMNIPAGQAILDNGCELPVEETTTTVEDTTTTEETTTTVEETTTTVEETTTSSVLASTTEQEFTTTTEASTTEAPTTLPTDVQPDELARTGSDAGTTAGMGLALLTTGGVLVVAGRRRSALNR